MSNAPAIGTITDHFGRTLYPEHLAFERPPTPLPNRVETDMDLSRWHEERTAAEADVARLGRERRGMLSSATVEQIRAHDDAIATAQVRVERAAAVIEDAERKFAERVERERAAQPERRKKHKAALEARDEAERIIREVYGPAAEMIAEALTKLAGLEAVIRAADIPPEGCQRAPSYEAFRHAGCTYSRALATSVKLPAIMAEDPAIWPARA